MRKNVKIGDIIEIPTAKGLAYVQYTHHHHLFGGLIRVFDVLFKSRPKDLSSLSTCHVRFSTFLPVSAVVNRGIFHVVGHCEVSPQNKPFPLFRDGVADPVTKKVTTWWLWDGKKEWKICNITNEQLKIPIREVLNDTMLVQLIEEGWTPEKDCY